MRSTRRVFLKGLGAFSALPMLGRTSIAEPLVLEGPGDVPTPLVDGQPAKLIVARTMPTPTQGVSGYLSTMNIRADLLDVTGWGDSHRRYLQGPEVRFDITIEGSADQAGLVELRELWERANSHPGQRVRVFVEQAPD